MPLVVNDDVIIREIDGVLQEIEGNGAEGEMEEYFRRTEEEMLNLLAVPDSFRDGLNTPHISMQSYGRDCGCDECQPVAAYGENEFEVGNLQDMAENNSILVDRSGNEGNEQFIFNEETVQFAPEVFRSNYEIQNENVISPPEDNNI